VRAQKRRTSRDQGHETVPPEYGRTLQFLRFIVPGICLLVWFVIIEGVCRFKILHIKTGFDYFWTAGILRWLNLIARLLVLEWTLACLGNKLFGTLRFYLAFILQLISILGEILTNENLDCWGLIMLISVACVERMLKLWIIF